MAKLNHTHIVAVYDFGITKDGHLYLVMEWVEGPTLHDMIHKGSLPVRKAAMLAMQLCEALSYAHTHQILHRDIKPGNIMVTQDDQVKVTDFGLARPITGEAEENPYGTPDYAAPEILGKGAVDQRVDIFAAGVVLYEMLTGRVPQTPRRTVTEYAPVSTKWDEVIEKAVHPDPAKRFQDARDLRASIASVLAQGQAAVPVAVVVEDDDDVPKAKAALKPLHLGLIAAAVVVIGIVLGAMFRGEDEKPRKQKKTVNVQQEKQTDDKKSGQTEPAPRKKEKKPGPVVVMPPSEPEPKKAEPEPKTTEPEPAKAVAAAAPSPAPMAAAPVTPPAVPAPENPLEAIQTLEERDPELAKLMNGFAEEWSANTEIDTAPETAELAGKYIPALQRNLTGLPPEQRDHILSEISHVANREPLSAPESSWPPVLTTLRNAYNSQIGAITSAADEAAAKMRTAQSELLLAKAKERAAAGNTEGARRAEALAAELAKLKGAPTLKAVKENLAATVTN